jgi:hypothetical protein
VATELLDFESATVGALPAGVEHYSASGSWTLTAQDNGGERGLRFAANGSGSEASFGALSTIGVVDNAADKEIVVHVKIVAGENVDNFVPVAMIFQSSSDQSGYAIAWDGTFTDRWRIGRLNGAGSAFGTVLTTLNATLVIDTVYRVRFRWNVGGVLRARIVEGVTDAAELANINAKLTAASLPTVTTIADAVDTAQAWDMSTTADTTYTGGRFAVGAYSHQAEPFYGLVGVATAGETAPASSGAAPADVTITDAGDEAFTAGETGVVIAGTNFGATQGAGKVWLSPTDNVAGAGRVQQTVTAWGDTSVTITVVRGALAFLTNLYLFVETNAATSNAAGHVVQLVPRVYIRETATALSGSAVALNGDALLVWRARPTAANANPSQVVTLGSIPSGAMDVEINRGTLAPGDPAWAMLVSAAGNAASAKRITPVYE